VWDGAPDGRGICYDSTDPELTCDKLHKDICGNAVGNLDASDCVYLENYGCVNALDLEGCGQKSKELCNLVEKDDSCIWNPFDSTCLERSCGVFLSNISCQIGNLLLGGTGCFWADSDEQCLERRSSCDGWGDDGEMCVFNGSVVRGTCFVANVGTAEENKISCVEQKHSCDEWLNQGDYCTHENSISVRDVVCEFADGGCKVFEAPIKQPSKNISGGSVTALVLAVIFGLIAAALLVIILIYIF
jgi:hypothetical protein